MASADDIGGVWRTIGGRRVFIKNGQSLSDAMRESGKFPSAKKNKNEIANQSKKEYNKVEDFECLKKYESLNDEDYEKSYTSHKDYILCDMALENGFDGLPTVVDEEEYNKLIKDGNIRVQRVVSDDNNNTADFYVNQFKNGEYFATGTHNQYGSGIYTSGDENDIALYSKNGKNSKVIEMAIDKTAKIKTFENQMDMYHYVVSELKNVDEKYQRALEDTGRILISQGYDVSYIKNVNYYVIYNRTKVYVKE